MSSLLTFIVHVEHLFFATMRAYLRNWIKLQDTVFAEMAGIFKLM